MKKIILKSLILIVFIASFMSCNDEYYDVNTPSDAIDVNDLNMKDLLGPVIFNTIYAQYSAETVFGNYTQYFGSYGNGALGEQQNSSTWSRIYLKVIPNLIVIREKAVEQGATHYEAVAKILTAINIGFATDSWGNIPYSEASLGTENTSPVFDTQEEIYTEVVTLLNEAITALQSTDSSGISVGSEDLIYSGNMDNWLKAAYTIKARYQLHLVNKGMFSLSDVLTSINNGLTSNSDNFLMDYASDKLNPWYSTEILSRNTGNFFRAPNDQLISMMNGTTYPFLSGVVTEDPRLAAIYENEGASGDPWRGFMNGGEGESSDGNDANTYYKDGGYYTFSSSPLILITYSEALFIKAEALFLNNGGTETSTGSTSDAYTAYLAGIAADMVRIGVSGADYMADTAVDVGMANLMLNHIMKEKYIANILNPETYNDFRRYNFSSNVFKGLNLRIEDDPSDEFYGQWFRRVVYPTSEKNANPDVVADNWQEPTVDVWWAE